MCTLAINEVLAIEFILFKHIATLLGVVGLPGGDWSLEVAHLRVKLSQAEAVQRETTLAILGRAVAKNQESRC